MRYGIVTGKKKKTEVICVCVRRLREILDEDQKVNAWDAKGVKVNNPQMKRMGDKML